MRKTTLLLSTLVLFSMLFVACAPQETATAIPNTEFPTVEEPTTEPTLEEPVGTETGVPTQEGTPVGSIPVTGEEDPGRLSNQLNLNVWNRNGEQVGEVNDMVLDLDNLRVFYVIVGTGDRNVSVPWGALNLETEGGDMTGGEQFAFVLQADQETFENAPDFDLNTLPDPGVAASDWDTYITDFWEIGLIPVTPSAEGTPIVETATPGTVATVDPNATAIPGGTGATPGMIQGVILATELLGSNVVVGTNDEVLQDQDQVQATGTPGTLPGPTATLSTGTGDQGPVMPASVDDVIVDIETGEIQYIVLNAAFADGDRLVPIPLNQFQWDVTNDALNLGVDQAMLNDAPYFIDGQYPDTTMDNWDDEYYRFWY